MKDQKKSQGNNHHDQKSSFQQNSHAQKSSEKASSFGKETSDGKARIEDSESARKHTKSKESIIEEHFHNLDHDQISKFDDEMGKDEALKQKFIKEPDATLHQHGITVPQGVRATYDNQYVKPSDGSKVGMFGYRIGNIGFSK